MLAGHSCDEGYTMEAYLEMIENKGVPLPHQASNFCKFLLKGMMATLPSQRFSGEEALREVKKYLRSKQESIQQS
jgi:aromatic ring hydroxylase